MWAESYLSQQIIYGRYVYNSGEKAISCLSQTADSILKRIWPAFEDLFDEAEEHALSVLLVQWEKLCEMESQILENVIK